MPTGTFGQSTPNNIPWTVSAFGSEQMRLTSTGLGIGTSSPGAKLDVADASGGAPSIRLTNSVAGAWVRYIGSGGSNTLVDSNAGFTFRTGASYTTAAVLDSSGNLGLGVTPSAWASNIRATQVGRNGAFWSITDGAVSALSTNVFYDTAYKYISTAAASQYRQSANSHIWEIAPSGTAGNAITFTQALTLNASGQLETGIAGSASAPSFTRTGDLNTGIFFPAADTIAFAEGGVESMRIDSAGNVGIGTSSVTNAKLKVSGAGASGAIMSEDTSGSTSFVRILGDASSQNLINWQDGTALRFATSTQAYGTFNERMRLDSSGNLGLGVTPSSSWSGLNAMQIGARAAITGTTTYSTFSTNAVATTGGWASNYLTNGFAALYAHQVSNGQHQWFTAPSGTAGNAISFTQAMTLDASGNLGVGTTSPISKLHVFKSSDGQLQLQCDNTGTVTIDMGGTTTPAKGGIRFSDNSDALLFRTGSTERARIDSSGNLLVGTTVQKAGARATFEYDTAPQIAVNRLGTDGAAIVMLKAGTIVGTISVTGSATAYNTSSDYRLKNTIAPMTGALAKVALLKPCTYKWNADGSDGEGFIAHELAEVVPQCVTGEKDAVDAEGKPQYQGIDTSFLVATLTAAIQELKAEFDAYKASHP
jgi:hypothetical protein